MLVHACSIQISAIICDMCTATVTHTHTHTHMPAAHAQSLQPADAAPTLPAAPDSERNSQKSALWLFVW